MKMADEFKRLDRELVYKGSIVDFYKDTVKVPNGNVVKWDFIKHQGAAAVVPVLEDGRILMVRQYRNALERETWEIPAGKLDTLEESGLTCAIRELEEETGYYTEDMELLITVRTTVAFCDERIKIYTARNLNATRQHLDEDEYIDVKAFTMDELKTMILEQKIEDSKTIAALMSYAVKYHA